MGIFFLSFRCKVTIGRWLSSGSVKPEKKFSAGRPIISVTDKNGEIARLVSKYECGAVVGVGNSDELTQKIAALSANPERVADMGRRARMMLDAEFSRKRAFERWNALFESAAVIR